jgi:hypothetical protein
VIVSVLIALLASCVDLACCHGMSDVESACKIMEQGGGSRPCNE